MTQHACTIETAPEQHALACRTRGSVEEIPAILGRVYGEIMGLLQVAGENPGGAPFVIYYNEDMQNLDMEIGFPVNKVLSGKGDIKGITIPGGKIATTLHQGPYKEVEATYNKIIPFMQEQGVTPQGHVIEYYLNDPAVTPEAELLTKVVFPLK